MKIRIASQSGTLDLFPSRSGEYLLMPGEEIPAVVRLWCEPQQRAKRPPMHDALPAMPWRHERQRIDIVAPETLDRIHSAR